MVDLKKCITCILISSSIIIASSLTSFANTADGYSDEEIKGLINDYKNLNRNCVFTSPCELKISGWLNSYASPPEDVHSPNELFCLLFPQNPLCQINPKPLTE